MLVVILATGLPCVLGDVVFRADAEAAFVAVHSYSALVLVGLA